MKKRIRPRLSCKGEVNLVKQSFKDECDINHIMAKWQKTGQISDEVKMNKKPSYGDFSNSEDYMTACNAVIEAQDAFGMLPAKIRERFGNEPANLLQFLSMEENQEEAIKLGLADGPTPEAPPEPTPEGTEGVTVTSP